MYCEKHTSEHAAEAASKVLRDDRTGADSKTAAGSALSQKEGSASDKSSSGKPSESQPDKKSE